MSEATQGAASSVWKNYEFLVFTYFLLLTARKINQSQFLYLSSRPLPFSLLCQLFCVDITEKQQFSEISRVCCCLVFLSIGSSGEWHCLQMLSLWVIIFLCQHPTLPFINMFCGLLVFVARYTLQSSEWTAFMLIQHLGLLKTVCFMEALYYVLQFIGYIDSFPCCCYYRYSFPIAVFPHCQR